MLAHQSYGGHTSVHDEATAAKLGLAGAPIEGPTHFSQFEPLGAALWGDRWFSHGCISAHFQTMVIEGEQVQAQMTLDGPGGTRAQIDACKADGTPVLTGTASIGPDHGQTALDSRLAAVIARPPEKLYVLDLLKVGQKGRGEETICVNLDDHLGDLYPFTLRQKLQTITEHVSYHQEGATTPWGGAIFPFEMMSVITNAFAKQAGFAARQPSLGLFIDLEVKMLGQPVRVGKTYRLERVLLALGASKRTESMWTRTTLFDGATPVAEVLLHQGVFKASYPGYPAQAS
jgi:hypothetical protein